MIGVGITANQKVGAAVDGAEIEVESGKERAEIPVGRGKEIGIDTDAAERMREAAVVQGAAVEVVERETEVGTEKNEAVARRGAGGRGAEVEIEGGIEMRGSPIR